MKTARYVFVFFLLAAGAYGQNVIVSTPLKDPVVPPEQKTAAIVHYEKMRFTARSVIRELALDLQNADGGSKPKIAEAMNYQEDIVDWANWCILALRDKTSEAKACVFRTDLR
jgi:hypothetical protein